MTRDMTPKEAKTSGGTAPTPNLLLVEAISSGVLLVKIDGDTAN